MRDDAKYSIVMNALALLYNALIISGCTYLVFWKGASPGWYILAILLLTSVKKEDHEK